MDRQTLRDWVHRYNERGVPGLSDQPRAAGADPKLNTADKEQLAAWVCQGPSLEEDGVVRWRLSDLQRRILERFFVILDECSVDRMLKAMCESSLKRDPTAEAPRTH